MIVVYGKQEASVSLYFDGLPTDLRRQMLFLAPDRPEREKEALLDASLVMVVREFGRLVVSGTAAMLRNARVPLIWFTDDDLVALGREEAAFRFYTPARVRRFAAACAALVATSPALARALAPLHRTVLLWPCVLDESLAPSMPVSPSDALRVGVFGGGFRAASLEAHVLPAMAALRRWRPVTVFAAHGLLAGTPRADVVALPFETDFRSFIARWQTLRLHAVVHPYGRTGNIANKSCASILAAWYLGAVPIVGEEPAYAALGEAEGVLKAAPNPAAWQSALERAADPGEAATLFGRLTAWCRSACDPEGARAPFAALLQAATLPPSGLVGRLRARLAPLLPAWFPPSWA
jgi:hypothetical protein